MKKAVQQAAWREIVTTIRQLLVNESYQKLSERLGVGASTIHGWVNGRATGVRIGYDDMMSHAQKLGINIEHYFSESSDETWNSDVVNVPHVEAKLGAGASLVTSAKVIETIPFPRSFFSKAHINSKDSVIFDVVGDSMEPVIPEGAVVLVSITEGDIKPRSGRIIAVRIGEEIMVKRFINMGDRILLQSENKNRPDHEVFSNSDGWAIIGIVRWCSFILN